MQEWKKLDIQWMVGSYHVNDPVQGRAANCALIAALSSLAWVQLGLIPSATDPTTIPFYSEPNPQNPQPQNITVDWNLCYEGSTLVYAHSSSPNEIWPAIYEKAYGSWRLGSIFISCSNYEDVDWGGNPCTALTHLTNKAGTTKYNAGKTATTIKNDIRLKCYANGKTKYPMVAWTYTSPPDVYDDIDPAHSYSLLGLSPTSTGSDIVLRNPFGVNDKSSSSEWNTININNGGVFKVPDTIFQRNFEAYGYVVL